MPQLQARTLDPTGVALGFVTASRQAVAHATGSSLEQLHLQVDLESPAEPGSFTVEGLAVVGAEWRDSQLNPNNGATVSLGPSQISWRKETRSGRQIQIPLFLDETRAVQLFAISLPAGTADATVFAQRAICLVAIA